MEKMKKSDRELSPWALNNVTVQLPLLLAASLAWLAEVLGCDDTGLSDPGYQVLFQ